MDRAAVGVASVGSSARANSAALANRSAAHRRERPGDRLLHALRDAGAHVAHSRHLAAQALGDHRLGGGSGERRLARQHLVEHRAEAVHIGPGIQVPVARRLLRAHVGRRAHAQASLREPLLGPTQGAGDAEVGHERAAILCEEQILGLDVPVDHAVVVGVLKRPGSVRGDPERDIHRELRLATQPVAETLPFNEGHGEPELPGGCPGVVHR